MHTPTEKLCSPFPPMPAINQVALSGRVFQEPEVRSLESGHVQVRFTLAVSLRYKDRQDSWQQETLHVPVVIQDRLAQDAAEYLAAGQAVFLTGRLVSRASNEGPTLEVRVRNLQLLEGKKAATEEDPSAWSQRPDP